VLPLKNRVIRDSAVQLGLTHQRDANGVDSPGRIGGWFEGILWGVEKAVSCWSGTSTR
jgi:hypothetical protein